MTPEVATLPTDAGLADHMRAWRGATAKLIELEDRSGRTLGNHGDWIMYRVFRRLLLDYGISTTSSSRDADLLIVPPNGALLDSYQAPELVREKLGSEPDLPVVIFPSSARFLKMDPASMFTHQQSGINWFLRERYSLDGLQDSWGESLKQAGVTLHLDHDVVVGGHRHVPALFSSSRHEQGSPLLVSRLGAEARELAADRPTPSSARSMIVMAFNAIPDGPLKRSIRRSVTRHAQQNANTYMMNQVGRGSLDIRLGEPLSGWIDISDPTLASREQYLGAIGTASLVVTNRLHVALPATILGKRTVLIDSGYHKLRGVYENSLTEARNLSLISRNR